MSIMRTLPLLTAAALAAGGLGLSATATATAAPADCLWASAAHPQGETVVAGGSNFTCTTDAAGPHWAQGQATSQPSTVPTPGADSNPAGLFSAGARQPGTDYDDDCVGDQLVMGVQYTFEAVAEGGGVYWKSVGPISQWTFDPGVNWPTESSRDALLACHAGSMQ
ncbi:hypothetical protein [Nocardia sp. NBC_01327]|uniref:hypothetical protein n=1 Tax=Nocardia sp. NBC_01327 TaxID=2903593 RepID=UPI002E0D5115|nr:hypothetical protein OG326_29565 [Nocardia sp. NBC_01327]